MARENASAVRAVDLPRTTWRTVATIPFYPEMRVRLEAASHRLSPLMEEALFWTEIYSEILALEENVVARIQELMSAQSPSVRWEVEGTKAPVIAPHLERFRQRHEYWALKVKELQLADE